MIRRLLALTAAGLLTAGGLRATVDARTSQAPAAQTPPAPAAAASTEPPPEHVWVGAYTEEQAKRGETVYVQECSNCHGPELEGADMSPALQGAAFTANWNDLSVGDLFERIRISMPQDRPGKLSRQQISDVMAFMFRANKFPAGKSELRTELPLLKQIKILAQKPE